MIIFGFSRIIYFFSSPFMSFFDAVQSSGILGLSLPPQKKERKKQREKKNKSDKK
jgi:hypothetical protein